MFIHLCSKLDVKKLHICVTAWESRLSGYDIKLKTYIVLSAIQIQWEVWLSIQVEK